jgi:hypothetical protein
MLRVYEHDIAEIVYNVYFDSVLSVYTDVGYIETDKERT